MTSSEARGSRVGALVGDATDEVFSIKASGGVPRVSDGEVNPPGRVTMGVRFISLADDDTVVAIARNAERAVAADEDELDEAVEAAHAETTPPAGDEGTDQ
jgi:DNA gyrase subunit A